MTTRSRLLALACLGPLLATGCLSRPLPTVDFVDLPRFMGDWYVLAHVPAPGEDEAFNSIESYRLVDRRTVATTYRFRDGGFDAPVETLEFTGLVRNFGTNATWAMRPFWPVDLEYLVTYVDPGYRTAIIARSRRDFCWIMARRPDLSDAEYEALVARVEEQGYDIGRLRRIPQRWPDPEIDVVEGVPLGVPAGHGPLGAMGSGGDPGATRAGDLDPEPATGDGRGRE